MGLMDKVKQAVQGRSEMVEKGIDRAVGEVNKRTRGKYRDTLTQRAGALKDRARQLDDQRREPPPDGGGHNDVPPPA